MIQLTKPPRTLTCPQSRLTHLTGEQSLNIWLPAESRIVAQSGSALLIAAPQWIDGYTVRTQSTLSDGEVYQLADAGWVEVHSSTAAGCEILCLWELRETWYGRIARFFTDIKLPGRRRAIQGRTS